MNKPGAIVQTFGNPMYSEIPLGQVRLICPVEDGSNHCKDLEHWWVEYLSDPGMEYKVLIKKPE